MNETFVKRLIIGISILIIAIVVTLFYIHLPEYSAGSDLSFLPAFHATLNALTSACLIAAFYFVKRKNIRWHRNCMLLALVLSTIFLVSYVIYHSLTAPTPYGGTGILRYIYYFVLLSHVVLAAGILPFILFTFYRAIAQQIELHKKIARWTWPLWLYVAITGVLVYVLISPYYA